MKKINKVLLIIVAILALVVLIGVFMPSKVSLERSIVIDAPIEMIYDQVHNLHNWEKWSPWHKIDTNMGLTYQNGGIGEGASYIWTSDHSSVGNGTLTITEAKSFEYIKTVMDFGEKGSGTADFKFEKGEGGIIVSWNMHSDLGNNPVMKLFGPLMKKSITSAYDSGLDDIKTQCDYLKTTDWYYVKLKTKGPWKYYGITNEKTTMETMENTMGEFFGKLYGGLGAAQIEANGSAFAVYYSWGDEFEMECGLPVEDNSKAIKGLEAKEMPEHKYAALKLEGSYDNMDKAHTYLMDWLKSYDLELTGAVVEKYKVGPGTEADPKKWITYILYPVD